MYYNIYILLNNVFILKFAITWTTSSKPKYVASKTENNLHSNRWDRNEDVQVLIWRFKVWSCSVGAIIRYNSVNILHCVKNVFKKRFFREVIPVILDFSTISSLTGIPNLSINTAVQSSYRFRFSKQTPHKNSPKLIKNLSSLTNTNFQSYMFIVFFYAWNSGKCCFNQTKENVLDSNVQSEGQSENMQTGPSYFSH